MDKIEKIDKSLEKVSEKKYPVYWKDYPKDGIVRSESYYDTNKQRRDAFVAGAKWQKEQMDEQARQALAKTDITLADLVAFDEGFKLGRRLERQDMMKDAVEGVLVDNIDGTKDICLHENRFGDKVRIVVLKAEEE